MNYACTSSADYGFTARRISLDDSTSVTASSSTTIHYKRTREDCPKASGGTRETRFGCPRPGQRDGVYASTFGTRRRDAADRSVTFSRMNRNGNCNNQCCTCCCERMPCHRSEEGATKQPPFSSKKLEKHCCCTVDTACKATDDERQRGDTTAPLPYWHIAIAAARLKEQECENQYNKERAAQAWDKYFADAKSHHHHCGKRQKMESRNFSCHHRNASVSEEQVVEKYSRHDRYEGCNQDCVYNVERNCGKFYKCGGNVNEASCKLCEDDEPCEIMRKICKPSRKSPPICKRRNQSAPPVVGRPAEVEKPFYGATELEKSSLNAINHLLKAEKELRRVQFTAGSILPQAKQYIEQVDAIHQDLKLFNTQIHELQKQTNDVLEKKGARHFHFMIQGSPTKYKPNAPLPSR
uniref:Uncharacterized protein n=1 Tax=Haemonchus contortus TaxID=6289 RepID=A0A7I5EDR8_HAECO